MSVDSTRAGVGTSRHRLGMILSAIGFGVVMVLAAAVLVSGLVATGSMASGTVARASIVLVSPLVTVTGLFVASCLLLPGEQLRRGRIFRNPAPPPSFLPQASVVSRFRPLALWWHALWVVVALAISGTLIVLPILWQRDEASQGSASASAVIGSSWHVDALFALAVAGVGLGSLLKKALWMTRAHAGRARPEIASAAWRFIDYRWRIDLWIAALGWASVAIGAVAVPADSWSGRGADSTSDRLGFAVFAAVGIFMIALSIWMSSNYWRADRPMGDAESYS